MPTARSPPGEAPGSGSAALLPWRRCCPTAPFARVRGRRALPSGRRRSSRCQARRRFPPRRRNTTSNSPTTAAAAADAACARTARARLRRPAACAAGAAQRAICRLRRSAPADAAGVRRWHRMPNSAVRRRSRARMATASRPGHHICPSRRPCAAGNGACGERRHAARHRTVPARWGADAARAPAAAAGVRHDAAGAAMTAAVSRKCRPRNSSKSRSSRTRSSRRCRSRPRQAEPPPPPPRTPQRRARRLRHRGSRPLRQSRARGPVPDFSGLPPAMARKPGQARRRPMAAAARDGERRPAARGRSRGRARRRRTARASCHELFAGRAALRARPGRVRRGRRRSPDATDRCRSWRVRACTWPRDCCRRSGRGRPGS